MLRKVEISHRTIIFTVVFLGLLWILYLIREILLILFVSTLIMVVLNPVVKRLSKFKIPRALSVLIVYLAFFGVVIISIVSIIPPLVDQTTNFASHLPNYIANLHIPKGIDGQIYSQLSSKIGDVPGSVVNTGVWIVSNIFTLLTILTFAFYLLMARDRLDDQLAIYVGSKKSKEINGFLDELEIKLGGWARGQIILMLSVGFLTYIGLTIIGIPYALPLGIFAAILEAVPYVGPILGAVPSVLIGFGISPLIGVVATLMAFMIQQLENYVLVPKIMEKSVGVAPIVTLLSLAVGFKLAGITGVLISVPVVITSLVLVKRHFLV